MFSLNNLNSMQRLAAETVQGPVLILAGAGSGKTSTITHRMAHMVANLNISPKSILGVTFTNKAAREMRERVISLIGHTASHGMTLSTFHALCVSILKKHIEKLGYHSSFNIYDTSDQMAIIREALNQYRSDKDGGFDRKTIQARISFLKNQGISPEQFPKSKHFDYDSPYDLATQHCFQFYRDKMRFYNAIDFDDILFLTASLFRKFPELATSYSKRFQYIMVDEYQDTNALQFELILALTSTHKNLCVVGDDDQSIYAFRGADITNILSFDKHFSPAKVIKLEENYRSTQPILELANHVIAQNKVRKQKTLFSQKKSTELPILWSCGHTEHEAQAVTEDILQYWRSGKSLNDIAILYRSKTQVEPFEAQLRMSQIPYTIIGGQKLYDKKEIKDIMSYLTLIYNTRNELALRRILNVPNRGIGQATLDKYLALKESRKCDLFSALENNPSLGPTKSTGVLDFIKIINHSKDLFAQRPLHTALTELISSLGYYEFINHEYKDAPKQAERKRLDVEAFIQTAEHFYNYHKQNTTLDLFVEKIILQDSQDQADAQEDQNKIQKNEIALMTLHSAKGLEFERVYFVGTEEDLLPHKKTMSEGTDISEELRLCYVGITRARKKLILTYCKERTLYGKKVPRHKSRFLEVLKPGLLIEQDRTTFGHLTPEEAKDYKKNFFKGLIDDM
ncbi:MAG: UvrD-helicase domain-containing protein [Bdellovibrio sp.]|nr:UvrD-helicase domain-containing protein [Bdellovibrio sp.]